MEFVFSKHCFKFCLGITLNGVLSFFSLSFSAVKEINDADNKSKESSPKVSAVKFGLY